MHAKRNIHVRSVRRPIPDLRKLSRALIAVAMAQAEKEAAAQHEAAEARAKSDPTPSGEEKK
jgi:hypothetical protein